MSIKKRRSLLLAAFVAATLVGSRLPEEIAWEGIKVAGAPAAECRPMPGSGRDGSAPACEGEVVWA